MSSPLTYQLHQLVRLMDALAERELRAAHGIGYGRFHPLAVLVTIEPANQHQLASALGVTDAAVSRSMRPLVESGLVEVGVDPAHGRHNQVRLTATGRELAEAGTRTLEAVFAEVLGAADVAAESYGRSTEAVAEALRDALGRP